MGEEDVLLVYVTAASAEEARRIGRALVEERLAACVNLLAPHTAIYRWQGVLEEGAESAFIAKTVRSRLPDLTRRIRTLSSYTLPAIVALPAAGGDAEFLAWVRAETADPVV